MTKKIFYNNPGFRIASPILLGIIVYLLVLMFFDSVEMLLNNFFSREVLFVIGLTLLFLEVNRLVIVILNKFMKQDDAIIVRIGIQYLTSLILVVASVSFVLHLYFTYVEGFSTIQTELITFNAIYIFATLFYHLYYFSLQFLFKRNDDLFLSEQIERDNLELQLNTYKNQINPEFLFQTLETIVGELYHNKKNADKLVDQLAQVYRYTLDNQNNELINLANEIESLKPVFAIFGARYPDSLLIRQDIKELEDYYLVPGTLQILLEHTVSTNLLSGKIPLSIGLKQENGSLCFQFKSRERISGANTPEFRLDQLKKTYNHLAPGSFETRTEKGMKQYRLPLLKVEEE